MSAHSQQSYRFRRITAATGTCLVAVLVFMVPITLIQLQSAVPMASTVRTTISYEQYLEFPTVLTVSKYLQASTSSIPSTSQMTLDDAINSATGKLFRGDVIRTFNGAKRFQNYEHSKENPNKQQWPATPYCDKWNVVTTIFAPSEAVKRAASVHGWCTVIVADTKTPTHYIQEAGLEGNRNINFLSVQDQEDWRHKETSQNSAVGAFLNVIPYHHFGRKNVGYLYAIQHGAKILFDFDDDNLLPLDNKNGQVLPPLTNTTHLHGARIVESQHIAFNHHSLLGAPIESSWARGFPLEYIQTNSTYGNVVKEGATVSVDQTIAVMQFCANGNPDIDAIHRLVHPLPMMFAADKRRDNSLLEGISTDGALVAPSNAFAPYNAQATIHSYNAMWALLLPMTVPGRVSDIWRAYFAQAIFRDAGLSLVMLPPNILQERNEHNYLADMQAELDLYFKGGKLLEFMSDWKNNATSVPARMEDLWIALHERSYIELDDVNVLQLWLAALVEIEYVFPSLLLG